MSTTKHIEVFTPQGETIASFVVKVSDTAPSKNGSTRTFKGNHKNGKSDAHGNGESMTEPQKKYLFRIYASQGIEGDEAHEKLKELFGVDALSEVSKLDASKMIENLLAEAKGGNGNGSSF